MKSSIATDANKLGPETRPLNSVSLLKNELPSLPVGGHIRLAVTSQAAQIQIPQFGNQGGELDSRIMIPVNPDAVLSRVVIVRRTLDDA